MDLALYLYKMGCSAPTAALLATLGVCAALVLLGVACVAFLERLELRSHCQPLPRRRGATRCKPGQP